MVHGSFMTLVYSGCSASGILVHGEWDGAWAGLGLEYRGPGKVFWVGTVQEHNLLTEHNGTMHLYLRYLIAVWELPLYLIANRSV